MEKRIGIRQAMDFLNELQSAGVISAEQRPNLEQAIQSGASLEIALLGAGVNKEIVRNKLAELYGVPAYIPTNEEKIDQKILTYIPIDAAKNYKMVPIKMEEGTLLVGVNDPNDFKLREALAFISTKYGMPYKFVFLLEEDLDTLMAGYENIQGEVGQALDSLESELDKEIAEKRGEQKLEQRSNDEYIKEDAPVTKVVATILRYAVDFGASDIHIEPTPDKVRVRFRVDGVLGTSLELPKKVQSAVVARIKILCSMRLDERRKPQDGRFSATFDGRKIDFRVSTFPTNHGEKVVMRILDNEKGVRSLEKTGISAYHLDIIRRAIKEPYGIILISGPTGSGKSTTLYAMLSEVDRVTKNVLSLEDPIEYAMDGVSQSQMRPEIGYSFANGLRTALRQDPDVILVGEIRDKETAHLAIQAALTGHLVLSTIHTNNAIGVIPRLVDMGVDPYLIAPVLKLAIAQRLARRIQPPAKVDDVDESMRRMFDEEFASLPPKYRNRIPKYEHVYHPQPSLTSATGMKGRVAVMEALQVDEEIQNLILNSGSEEQIYESARKNGFMSLKEDAIIKALQGDIPYEEVNKFGLSTEIEEIIDEEKIPDVVTETEPTTQVTTTDANPDANTTAPKEDSSGANIAT